MQQVAQIAVVDDDLAIREALNGLLGSLGYRCRLYASAEDYLACRERRDIGCVILDVCMPGLSGLELQELLSREGEAPPILFMTSYVDDTTRRRALAGGARGFFGKPVDDEALIRCLEETLAG